MTANDIAAAVWAFDGTRTLVAGTAAAATGLAQQYAAAIWDKLSRTLDSIPDLNVVVAGTLATVTWTAVLGTDHYTLAVNSGTASTFASGGTLGITAGDNLFTVASLDSSGGTLAIGSLKRATYTLEALPGVFLINDPATATGTFLTYSSGTRLTHRSADGSYFITLPAQGDNPATVVTVMLDIQEGAAAPHNILQGWTPTVVAVVQGLNPTHSASTTTLAKMALDAVIQVVGDRGSPCRDIDVPTYLEEFVPTLLSNEAVKVEIKYKGYPLPTYEIDGVLSQVESNLDVNGDPITVQYTYPNDYPYDLRKRGLTVTQGGMLQRDLIEPVVTVKFLIVPGVTSFYGVMDVPPGLFIRPGGVLSATDMMTLVTWYYSGCLNKVAYLLGMFLGQPHQWKITSVKGVTHDGGRTYDASMSFQFREATWDPQATYQDTDDGGHPPPDLVEDVGYKQYQMAEEIDFPFFPTITN